MSRTTLNPKTGTNYWAFPGDNSFGPIVLGDILHSLGVECYKMKEVEGDVKPNFLLPYSGSPEYCQVIGKLLREVTEEQCEAHLRRVSQAYGGTWTAADIQKNFHRIGVYFQRLKQGYVECNMIGEKPNAGSRSGWSFKLPYTFPIKP